MEFISIYIYLLMVNMWLVGRISPIVDVVVGINNIIYIIDILWYAQEKSHSKHRYHSVGGFCKVNFASRDGMKIVDDNFCG